MGTVTGSVRRLRAAVAVALASLLLVTGCSDDEPVPQVVEPTESASPSSSASAAPEPEPWEVRSKAGAVAFVEHWVSTLNQVVSSRSTSELSRLSSRACQSCEQLIVYIDGVYARNGDIEGGKWTIRQVGDVTENPSGGGSEVTAVVRQSAQIIEADGRTQRVPSQEVTLVFTLNWDRGGWSLREYEAAV